MNKIYSAMDQPPASLISERRIITLLTEHEQGLTRQQIARELGPTEDDLLMTLLRIERSGVVALVEDGYHLVDHDQA